MKAKLLIASAVASSVLLSGCMTESMGEAIFIPDRLIFYVV